MCYLPFKIKRIVLHAQKATNFQTEKLAQKWSKSVNIKLMKDYPKSVNIFTKCVKNAAKVSEMIQKMSSTIPKSDKILQKRQQIGI